MREGEDTEDHRRGRSTVLMLTSKGDDVAYHVQGIAEVMIGKKG